MHALTASCIALKVKNNAAKSRTTLLLIDIEMSHCFWTFKLRFAEDLLDSGDATALTTIQSKTTEILFIAQKGQKGS